MQRRQLQLLNPMLVTPFRRTICGFEFSPPQLALDGQRLADERVPGIVNGGEARKLRSM